jgi:BCD family chlorophyll transporter-like MFS transporter
MMRLAGEGRGHREGTRVGLWGAAQAIAFGAGGLIGAVASDLARSIINDPGLAYGAVFFAEAGLFIVAAKLAMGIDADLDEAAANDKRRGTSPTHWKRGEGHEPA